MFMSIKSFVMHHILVFHRNYNNKYLAILTAIILLNGINANAEEGKCTGRFLNIGFWEPIRLIEITKTPFCLVSLGGIKVMSSKNQPTHKKIRSEHDKRSKAYYHIHYYVYPPLYLLNLISDFGCIDTSSYDLTYLSELDPSHMSDALANFMHPETFLLSNPIAKMACSVDCITSTATKKSMDILFWCAGCQGSIYPFTGTTESHIGGVATSQLLATRQIAKLHRFGLARKTQLVHQSQMESYVRAVTYGGYRRVSTEHR